MLDRIRELFAPKGDVDDASSEERLRTATCVILLEVAGADDEFAPEECERVVEALRARFDLSQDEAEELIRTAQNRRAESFDLWRFTSQINECCGATEKRKIIEEVWRVIYADGTLDAHEDYLVHKLARLLNLTHPQLIDAKMKVRQETGL